MSQEEEILLKDISLSPETLLFWCPDDSTCKQVMSITKRVEEEKMLCANFENGQYAVLYGCESRDFVVGTRLQIIK